MEELTKVLFKGTSLNIQILNTDNILFDISGIAQKYNKSFYDFERQKQFKEYLKNSVETYNLNEAEMIKKSGHQIKVHQSIMIEFMRWVNPKFSILANKIVYDVLTRGCETVRVQMLEKDKTIKKLKSSRYGKERGHGFESAFRIISNCEADISTSDFNNLLYDEGIIDSETVTITNFIANGTTSLEDKGTVLIHTDTAEAILDKYEIPRKIDSQMKFTF